MRIAYLTAGAAGMYCGSCMHDNALARALRARGHDCILLPVYTPIRTDQEDVSEKQLFFGGINVFLQQKIPVLGKLPSLLLRGLDAPWLLRLVTRRAASTQPEFLGDLTVSMLRGTKGRQGGEVRRLAHWLAREFQPDVILLTNLLIGGSIPLFREATGAAVYVWLQGDDIFLDHLSPRHRQLATTLMAGLARESTGLLVNSHFYAKKMGERLEVAEDKFCFLPLAIDVDAFAPRPAEHPVHAQGAAGGAQGASGGTGGEPFKIGYFARLAKEKGFHLAVDAILQLAQNVPPGKFEFHYGGWLGEQHQSYFQAQRERLARSPVAIEHRYRGSPGLAEKGELLRNLDLFSVPTVYEEPKGLFVLEALASGVPVVQPAHGAFPELLASTGGGVLVPPLDPAALADQWQRLMEDPLRRRELGMAGRNGVLARHTIEAQAAQLEALITGQS